ncbi:Adenylate kinase isoenzyme 6 like [Pseudolycoriella hygida]|uniref:Adenylate kinase isoenzyme 6 homolog n=1 Tax=Pseudolycoriella hygida TaxID=35572 RepID=A0A9Q0MX07_9DIPT|nr:Adenylate kinase isoenzyme 6 like [Pseudolycoriella hygida]
MKRANILITGTPGTGKTTLSKELAKRFGFEHLDISTFAKENDFVEEFDDEYECAVLDEDKLLDHLEPIMEKGGKIVDYHSCDFFPERWFDVVYVVQCDNSILFDRLTARGYNEKKIKSNIECEIFQTILEEAMDSYKKDIVFPIRGDSEDELQKNITTITEWYKSTLTPC